MKQQIQSQWWILLILLPLLVLVPGLVYAQSEEGEELEITAIDTTDFPHVRVFLAAPNGTLPTSPTLTLRDNATDIPADAMQIEQQRVGVAVAALIDLGRSMRGRGMPASTDRLQDAREVTNLIASSLDPATDLMSITVFNREPVSLQGLEPVDGGFLVNMVNDNDLLREIPLLFPDEPARRPTQEEYGSDGYSYSSVSSAVEYAVDQLTNPQTIHDDATLQRLEHMQKVIVLMGDSCDDDLSQSSEPECRNMSASMQSQLPLHESFSVFSIGLGSPNPERGQPKSRSEPGFAYNANFTLLEVYANDIPDGRFLHFYTDNEEDVVTKQEELQTLVVDEIVNRGEQLVLTYQAEVTGRDHELVIKTAQERLTASFEEPLIPPHASLNVEKDGTPDMKVTLELDATQANIKQADYYIDGEEAPITEDESPFSLDVSELGLDPGNYTVEVVVTDIRGEQSERSAALEIEVPVPPTPTPRPLIEGMPTSDDENTSLPNTIESVLRANLFSLIALLGVVVLAIVVLATPRGRTMATEASQRVTGVISRVTRPITSSGVMPQTADYVLAARQGTMTGMEFPLTQLNIYIGADQSLVDIVLNDVHVSGRHASINREGSALYFTDLGSTNGTRINGQRVTPNIRIPIQPGDMISMGGITLECVWKGSEPPAGGDGNHADNRATMA